MRLWRLFQQAAIAAYQDNCFGIAKGVAYSGLLALFPVVTSIAAILFRANAEAVTHTLARVLYRVVPPGSEDLLRMQFVARGHRPTWLVVVATLLSVWAASGAMMSLMEGFQACYRLPTGRSFLKQRGIAILLVFIGALPAVGLSFLIAFGARFLPGGRLAGAAIVFAAIACVLLVTGLVYKVGPNRPIKLKYVWPGTLVATGLWAVVTSGFGWYVRNLANYNVMYGSIAATIALLVWMYLLAVIALFGCEFNAERERLKTPLNER